VSGERGHHPPPRAGMTNVFLQPFPTVPKTLQYDPTALVSGLKTNEKKKNIIKYLI